MGWNKGGGVKFSELFDKQGKGGGSGWVEGGLELAVGRMFLTF